MHLTLENEQHYQSWHPPQSPPASPRQRHHPLLIDPFTLSELKQRINDNFQRAFEGKLALDSVQTASSKKIPMIQLADIVAGAANRRLIPQVERNVKDEMEDMIFEKLDLALAEGDLPGLDSAAWFRV